MQCLSPAGGVMVGDHQAVTDTEKTVDSNTILDRHEWLVDEIGTTYVKDDTTYYLDDRAIVTAEIVARMRDGRKFRALVTKKIRDKE